jgi:membrane protein implicated in regulation of membrane protease activity
MSPGITTLLVVVAVLAGIFLAGLYGDVVVGWVIFGVVAFVEAIASWTARAFRRLRPTQWRRSPELAGRRAASPAGRLP